MQKRQNLKKFTFVGISILVIFLSFKNLFGQARFLAAVENFKNWGLVNSISNAHIHATDAWKIETGKKNIVVAVVDTGIDANHPDLKNNLWKDSDGNYGYDFVRNKPNPIDEHGHGTHVAGIIGAAINSKQGIAGVAPNISIMAVRYYSDKASGIENLRNSIKALNWAIDHGAKIINYSGGGPEYSKEEFEAIKRAKEKGIIVVAAAGNERSNIDIKDNYYYPCAYRLENIICVTAININNQILPSSNYGKKMIDVAAPGENILSTIPGGRYATMTGTSQATAFVSGLVALLLSHDSSLNYTKVREILVQSVDKVSSLVDKTISGGKVNALAALKLVESKRIQSLKLVQTQKVETKNTKPNLERKISSPVLNKVAPITKKRVSGDFTKNLKTLIKEALLEKNQL